MTDDTVIRFDGISMWIEQDSSIHLEARTEYADPVEPSLEEAVLVRDALSRLIERLGEHDA